MLPVIPVIIILCITSDFSIAPITKIIFKVKRHTATRAKIDRSFLRVESHFLSSSSQVIYSVTAQYFTHGVLVPVQYLKSDSFIPVRSFLNRKLLDLFFS